MATITPSSSPDNALITVRSFPVAVEDLSNRSRLPLVDELRPAYCPGCGQPAHRPDAPLGIVGHGTYERQVRGLVPGESIEVLIRRYLCRGCGKTISVLPDALLPWRWYAGGAILLTLIGVLVMKRLVADLRESIGPGDRAPHWTSPSRWAGELLERLWSWKSKELGGHQLGVTPGERLRRLLGLLGVHARSPDDELVAAINSACRGTAHTRRLVTLADHAV